MLTRRLMIISALTSTIIVGTAAAALAASGNGTNLNPGGSACVGPVLAQNQLVLETGNSNLTGTQSGVAVGWSIWSGPDTNFADASRVEKATAKVISQYASAGSSPAYFWGCLFNSSTDAVDYNVSITPQG